MKGRLFMRRIGFAIPLIWLCVSVGDAAVLYDISLNTAPLIGHSAGPFSLEFQLNDGNGTGDANNTASLTNFVLNGGVALGSPTLTGGAAGDLASGFSLIDSSFFNQIIQGFTPGAALSFLLSLSTNLDSGGTPDEFSFAILDQTGTEIPTLSSFFDVFVQIDIDSANPLVRTFATDTSRTPEGGGEPINIDAPIVTPVSSVPEPMTLTLMLSGFGLLVTRKPFCHFFHRVLARMSSTAGQDGLAFEPSEFCRRRD